MNRAWATPTKWYPIPIALGALVLLAVQLRKQSQGDAIEVESQREGAVVRSSKIDGPWQVRGAQTVSGPELIAGTRPWRTAIAIALSIMGLPQLLGSACLVQAIRIQAVRQDLRM